MKSRLIFEDQTVFEGQVFAPAEDKIGEAVFNTAMSGYQEILTDPSYHGQLVVMTYPLIGSYGINSQDSESRSLFLDALICREYIAYPSNWRSEEPLQSYLERHHILGVQDIDTRALTRYLRCHGAQKCLLTTSQASMTELLSKLKKAPDMVGLNLAQKVSCQNPYLWPAKEKSTYRIAVIDCGVKHNILRLLAELGCECHIFPQDTPYSEILNRSFDGLFISNGPGDPEPVTTVIHTIENLLGKLPIFGICLGHQLLGIALGGKTYKLKFGHHGANHPVKNITSGHVEITSQNHGFCLDMDSLPQKEIKITHINLNDGTVEGLKHTTLPAFSVQYHPESAPGPHDSRYLFQNFIQLIKEFNHANHIIRT